MHRPFLILLWFAASAHAVSIAIVNPGFEDISGESSYNEFTFGPLNGWDLYDPGNVTSGGDGPQYWIGTLQPTILPAYDPINPQFFPGGAPEGSRVGIAYNVAASAGGGEYGFSQTLSATLQANLTYTLSALIGNIASGRDVANNLYNLNGFPGYRIDLLAGATLLSMTQTVNPGSIPEGQFAAVEYQYTVAEDDPLIGQALTIRLVNLNVADPLDPSADLEVDFDHISLTAVPEPSFALLMGFGIFGLCIRRRS